MVSKFVEDKDGIFNIQFSFFLQLLHSSDDFSGKTSDFEFFILLDIEQNNDFLSSNGFVFFDIVHYEFLTDEDIDLFKFVSSKFDGSFFFELL